MGGYARLLRADLVQHVVGLVPPASRVGGLVLASLLAQYRVPLKTSREISVWSDVRTHGMMRELCVDMVVLRSRHVLRLFLRRALLLFHEERGVLPSVYQLMQLMRRLMVSVRWRLSTVPTHVGGTGGSGGG